MEEVEKLARAALVEASGTMYGEPADDGPRYVFTKTALGILAEKIALVERERCAKLCEETDARCPECAAHNDHDQCIGPTPSDCAAAIRKG